ELYHWLRRQGTEEEYSLELGRPDLKREGSLVALIAYGAMVHTCLIAADELEKQNINPEVIDLRKGSPIDVETIVESVKKTNRAVVVQEAQRQAGVAANIVSEIQERAILHLEAPVLRVTAPDTVYAFAAAENDWLPDHEDV